MLKTVESLFIAYRLTGDRRYRDDGWQIFEAIEKHCRVPSGGYAAIINVDENPATQEDKMEMFSMVRDPPMCECMPLIGNLQSETLKYLYLLFSDDSVMSLHGA